MNAPSEPKHRWPPVVLWTLGVGLALAVIPLAMWHGHLYYAEGGRSPDGPGMLLMSIIMTSPVWLGCWIVFLGLFLVRYRGGARLGRLRGGARWSAMLGILAAAATALFLWLLIARVDFWKPTRLPFTLHLLALAGYCQLLRAAAVTRSLPVDDDKPGDVSVR